jgi:HEPN domain-containing protein
VTSTVDRKSFQNLAKLRLGDAKALLSRKRWSAAYYLCGYAVECALKACLLRYLGESDAIFGDREYLRKLADCWTHKLTVLVKLAGLEAKFGAAQGKNLRLKEFWGVTAKWDETSRYQERNEAEARELYDAISNDPDGVFQWLKSN